MSHPSKLAIIDTAVSLKYKTYLYFIFTKNPVINLERIKSRIQKGGHDVNSKKTIDRFYRSLALLPDAIKKCDRAFIFDNTVSLELIAEFKNGKQVNKNDNYNEIINAITKQ
jgi:predicted ABC-type ATPase